MQGNKRRKQWKKGGRENEREEERETVGNVSRNFVPHSDCDSY